MKSEIVTVLIVLLIVFGWIGISLKWQYENDLDKSKQEKAFIQQLNNEKCKLVEVLAADSVFGSPRYKYLCKDKSYTLNVDLSNVLTSK
ncbi:hypothetical protein ABTC85_15395 [Acinetobacter baumannii]|uniref:Uncharacterized protein n=1 Tax=Acinetobacter baumannii TaxID=470 RepID=A0A0C4XXD9_ACIBA|nr:MULTISPECIES: hypothetical protein [Acinetobacter calcoaceticus/baumannii complex]AFI97475.1 hypothetical protein ABTJ_p0097 [Acinetobacter baumannii MDR-TJ]AGQ12269.1 hypothetical protein BJAB0868_p0012 [Acinetobacter baumannii BJAB0868]AGQ16130.1 hypothetical protein BJAB07104_p0002 [Acinetobacter baumannii BJAB07104]AJF79838.1 hypothetical protein NG19_002 [Acinetobacter baumannii]APF45737.1 hypothetical protein BKJ37_19565 [Acinetobacter baumannii]